MFANYTTLNTHKHQNRDFVITTCTFYMIAYRTLTDFIRLVNLKVHVQQTKN